jgi:SNF2 family DNA or RNA helicase
MVTDLDSFMAGECSCPSAFLFSLIAHRLSLVKGFDELLSLRELPELTLFRHQLDVVKRVTGSMGGRAILADEVGLGKTIEAGVILKEYLARGMVRRGLILVPASLLLQWKDELTEKLNIGVTIGSRPGTWDNALVLASLDTAKKPENAREIWGYGYDILIVDEAHRLKTSTTLNWQFVNRIRKRFLLLLTATPVQNELKELYNMVNLLKPGQLRTYQRFKREFMLDKRTPKNPVELKRLLDPILMSHKTRHRYCLSQQTCPELRGQFDRFGTAAL